MQSKLSVVEYTFEMINDEMVLYTKSNNKIMSLNKTAVFVLRELEKLIKNDDEIVVENIAKKLIDEYSICEPQLADITKDVQSTINLFIETSLLKNTSTGILQGESKIQ